MHAGEVYRDEHGVAGTAANVAFRLLNAEPLKHALARSSGVLAVIVSDRIFEDVIRHVPGSRAASYRKVHISARGAETDAWIGLGDDPRPPELSSEALQPRQPVTQPNERRAPADAWRAWLGVFRRRDVRVSRTGRATAGARGKANTGFSGRSVPGDVRVDRTGDADGGDANTGIEIS